MKRLFESEADLKRSGYLFRITDNGGASVDRFTIITCDGDYFASGETPYHPQGFFQSGEGICLPALADRLETGQERELRWIDLPDDVRRAVLGRLNAAFGDYLASGAADTAPHRGAIKELFGGGYDAIGRGIYRIPGGYAVESENSDDDGAEDNGPFATFREAVLFTLPQSDDLAGPEYHAAVDLWDDAGGPRALWDCEAEPPHPYEVMAGWIGPDYDFDGRTYIDVGSARDEAHARELAAAWRAENRHLASRYEILIGSKADRTFHRLRLEEDLVR